MVELAAVIPERHAGKVWKRVSDYTHAAKDNIIPLVGAELNKAILAMPTGFIKLDAGYQLVAITSLYPGVNLYVGPDGEWLGNYVPAALRAYPFQMVQKENAEEFTLCINEASGLVVNSEDEGNAFFDDQDQPAQGIKDILNFLTEVEKSRLVIQGAVNALADAGLITTWEINIKQGEKVAPASGLFRIDEAALNNLNDEEFLTLRTGGGLAVAYAQLFSIDQLVALEFLDDLQGKIQMQQTAESDVANLTDFSISGDEGSLIFE